MAETTPPDASEEHLIEKPANFYLGREYDLANKAVMRDRRVEYDARNLTTHGVIVGMTGSGKTGLSIALLEEAAIDGIPAVIIDPKGDLANLLLQFPNMSPADFKPWLNPDDAKTRNISLDEYAEQIARRWKEGLRESGQGPERILGLTKDVDYRLYTPGSEAGLALSILRTFAAPKEELAPEDMAQKINATATALFGLSGVSSDPVQSREHVLVAQLLQYAWKNKRNLDLAGLIKEIQTPPIDTVGAYNLETFFPSKERLKFASQLNNMLASPVFTTWTRGESLDFGGMLYRNGRPQHLIFYLAHLDDQQRMFFTTLLLEEMLSWTRRQSGTTSLRAILYFDEVFGYLPPHPANPPSKQPLLTLLKQARAFGVGVLLATQNPVDLDYKALSNAGTWFVGKLQTERDKARLLDGLESVAAEYGTLTDRNYLEKVIASLGNRVFLLHNINQGKPILFQTRWALSFLRGPMTREQIKVITKPMRDNDAPVAGAATKLCNHCHAELPFGAGQRCPKCGKNPYEPVASAPQAKAVRPAAAPAAVSAAPPVRQEQPVLPYDVTQFYLPVAGKKPGHDLEYQPWLLGIAEVSFVIDKRAGSEHKVPLRLLARAPEPGHPVDWDKAMAIPVDPAPRPEPNARWGGVPESVDTGKKLKALEKVFGDHLYASQKLSLFENRELELISQPGEAREAFERRCREKAEERKVAALELEEKKSKPKPTAEIEERYKQAAKKVTQLQVKPRKADIRVTHFGLAWAPFWRPAG